MSLRDLAPMQIRAAHDQRVAESMTRGVKATLVLGGLALMAIGAVLLLMLTQATHNQALYERQYGRLLVVNAVAAAGLLIVIIWAALRLGLRLKRGKFGSQLLIKIALIFSLVGFLPGVLIYAVSYQFVSRSVESWFNERVERALTAGLSLGTNSLDALAAESANRVRAAAASAEWPQTSVELERLREQINARDVSLWNGQQQLLLQVGGLRTALTFDRPSSALMRTAQAQRVATQLDGLDDPGTLSQLMPFEGQLVPPDAFQTPRVRVLVAVPNGLSQGLAPADRRFIQAVLPLPSQLAADALAVQTANREYQERALARTGLKRMYLGTLTLSLFLAVFGAILLAVLLGNQLVRPLLVLAEGVREVAEGNLSPKPALMTRDELGGLTRSFAQMNQMLSDARGQVDASMLALSDARARLQTILDNQSAAVLVLGSAGEILMANPASAAVLRSSDAIKAGVYLRDIPGCAKLAALVDEEFEALSIDPATADADTQTARFWQRATVLNSAVTVPQDALEIGTQSEHAGPSEQPQILVRGAYLPNAQSLLVIDDITDIVSAQRSQAWGEVARRLAHEIKNPLTPIQLAAERLSRRLDGKLEPLEAQVLAKSVNTIVDQVDAMRRLVNEFRDYGRLPAAHLVPLELNGLVRDVLQLYAEQHAEVRVKMELAEKPLWIDGDAQQLRQVLHNLVQNAQEACEPLSLADGKTRTVRVKTALASERQIRLSIIDDGPGFTPATLRRAFEPYVTTKAKGTGLGLPVVKKISDDHHARIEINNRSEKGSVIGAQVSLSFAVAKSQHTAGPVSTTQQPVSP